MSVKSTHNSTLGCQFCRVCQGWDEEIFSLGALASGLGLCSNSWSGSCAALRADMAGIVRTN